VESGRNALAEIDALAAAGTLMALRAKTRIQQPTQKTLTEQSVQLKKREATLVQREKNVSQREKDLAAREKALFRRLNEGERSV
jgi:hypothetical protein